MSSSKNKLFIKNNIFVPEIAITAMEQERGLMYRDTLPEAMVFLYSKPQINKYWMKDTKKPLDIIFCKNNKIINIKTGKPFSTEIIGENVLSDTVIELPFGTCNKLNIVASDPIKLQLTMEVRKILFKKAKFFY